MHDSSPPNQAAIEGPDRYGFQSGPCAVIVKVKTAEQTTMTTVTESSGSPLVLHFGPALNRFTEDEFFELCQRNRDLRIERTRDGDLIIMPPSGGEIAVRVLNQSSPPRRLSPRGKRKPDDLGASLLTARVLRGGPNAKFSKELRQRGR